MLNQEPLPGEPSPEEPAIESLLAGFSPKENAIDRERLMFLAGYEAAKKELERVAVNTVSANRRWKFLAFASSVAAAGLTMLWLPSFSSFATANRNVHSSASPAIDAGPIETSPVESATKKSAVVAMAPTDESKPSRAKIGPANGFLRLRDRALGEEGFEFVEQSVGSGGGVNRPRATQRQLYFELPHEMREALSPVDRNSSSEGPSRLGERS
jgi:hypothetical protein